MRIPVLALPAVFFLGDFMSYNYVSFKPIYQRGDRLVFSEKPIPKELYENIKAVFKFYDVPYIESENDELLIPKNIWNDLDTMWNYTTKAGDLAWLIEHKQEK
jgi:hypothetical protein